MWSHLVFLFAVCLSVCRVSAQINPLLMGMMGEDNIGALMALDSMNSRLAALEMNIRTGAIGGCESGVIGPFTSAQNSAQLRFRGRFLAPPSISLALSNLATKNTALPIQIQVRPTQVTAQGATVMVSDGNNNVGQAVVTYMACPSSVTPPVRMSQPPML